VWSTGTGRRFTAAPTVAEGTVFTRERGGIVAAYDRASGARLWAVGVGSTPIGVDFPVQVLDGVAYVSGAQVQALDAATGAARWSTAVKGGAGAYPLVVADTDVYVDAEDFTALDRATGQVRWTAAVGNSAILGYSQPAVSGDIVFVGGGDGAVRAFDRASGALRWSSPVTLSPGAGAAPNVMVANGIVYATSAKVVQALDSDTGVTRWSHALNSFNFAGTHATLVGGVLVVPADELRAFDAVSGAVRWSRPLDATVFAYTPMPVDGLSIYLSAADGRLHEIDAVTGADVAVLGTEPPPLPGRSSLPTQAVPPAVADGTLYLASGDRKLYAYAP
jgi:outer membrane protein assembly factor BamB